MDKPYTRTHEHHLPHGFDRYDDVDLRSVPYENHLRGTLGHFDFGKYAAGNHPIPTDHDDDPLRERDGWYPSTLKRHPYHHYTPSLADDTNNGALFHHGPNDGFHACDVRDDHGRSDRYDMRAADFNYDLLGESELGPHIRYPRGTVHEALFDNDLHDGFRACNMRDHHERSDLHNMRMPDHHGRSDRDDMRAADFNNDLMDQAELGRRTPHLRGTAHGALFDDGLNYGFRACDMRDRHGRSDLHNMRMPDFKDVFLDDVFLDDGFLDDGFLDEAELGLRIPHVCNTFREGRDMSPRRFSGSRDDFRRGRERRRDRFEDGMDWELRMPDRSFEIQGLYNGATHHPHFPVQGFFPHEAHNDDMQNLRVGYQHSRPGKLDGLENIQQLRNDVDQEDYGYWRRGSCYPKLQSERSRYMIEDDFEGVSNDQSMDDFEHDSKPGSMYEFECDGYEHEPRGRRPERACSRIPPTARSPRPYEHTYAYDHFDNDFAETRRGRRSHSSTRRGGVIAPVQRRDRRLNVTMDRNTTRRTNRSASPLHDLATRTSHQVAARTQDNPPTTHILPTNSTGTVYQQWLRGQPPLERPTNETIIAHPTITNPTASIHPAHTPPTKETRPVARGTSMYSHPTPKAETWPSDDSESSDGGTDTPNASSDGSDGEDVFKLAFRTRSVV